MANASANDVNRWRERIVGLDERLPLLDGRLAPYINLDNAASTPPFREVVDAVNRFLPYYSSVHRGTGFKSRLSTAAYDEAHDTIARFVGADTRTQYRHLREEHDRGDQQAGLPLPAGAAERRALDRDGAPLERSPLAPPRAGRSRGRHPRRTTRRGRRGPAARGLRRAHRAADRERRVERHRLPPAHPSSGAKGSRRRGPDSRRCGAAGAHTGASTSGRTTTRSISTTWCSRLTRCTRRSAPGRWSVVETPSCKVRRNIRGAARSRSSRSTDVHWAGLPDREEAGSPNVVGAVAMAVAAQTLMNAGMDSVTRHEASLTAYALERLQSVPGIDHLRRERPATGR